MMTQKLTIHFHVRHYKESGCCFMDYMFLLLYEQRDDWTIKELASLLSQCGKTIIRIRQRVIAGGYLEQRRLGRYVLTDKLYGK
jgi:hypothetical protein